MPSTKKTEEGHEQRNPFKTLSERHVSMLFTVLSAYAAIRAAYSTDMPHLLAYLTLAILSLLLVVFGHEVSDIDD